MPPLAARDFRWIVRIRICIIFGCAHAMKVDDTSEYSALGVDAETKCERNQWLMQIETLRDTNMTISLKSGRHDS